MRVPLQVYKTSITFELEYGFENFRADEKARSAIHWKVFCLNVKYMYFLNVIQYSVQ